MDDEENSDRSSSSPNSFKIECSDSGDSKSKKYGLRETNYRVYRAAVIGQIENPDVNIGVSLDGVSSPIRNTLLYAISSLPKKSQDIIASKRENFKENALQCKFNLFESM